MFQLTINLQATTLSGIFTVSDERAEFLLSKLNELKDMAFNFLQAVEYMSQYAENANELAYLVYQLGRNSVKQQLLAELETI